MWDQAGFWWAKRWSALHSHVRSAIAFGSRVTSFAKKPSSPVCRQKGTLNNFSQHSVPFPFSPPQRGWGRAFAVPGRAFSLTRAALIGGGDQLWITEDSVIGWPSSCTDVVFIGLLRGWAEPIPQNDGYSSQSNILREALYFYRPLAPCPAYDSSWTCVVFGMNMVHSVSRGPPGLSSSGLTPPAAAFNATQH